MKKILILILAISLTYEKVIEFDFEKGKNSASGSDKTLTIITSLEDLPEETSGIINVFIEKENCVLI